MNKKNVIYFIISLFFATQFAYAQDNESQNRWLNDVREYKQEFLTREISLTPEQQTKFFPLYQAMEEEIFKLNKDTRALERKVSAESNVNDVEYETTAKAMLDVKAKEAAIETDYFEKFKTILSAKQLFLLKRAETRFSRNMLNHHRERQAR